MKLKTIFLISVVLLLSFQLFAQHPDAVFPIPQNYSGDNYEHINLYTGNLNYRQTVATVSGRKLSYALDFLYNSKSAELNDANTQAYESNSLGGYGWKLLDYPKIVSSEGSYYLLDGYRSYPLASIDGETNIYTTGYAYYLWRIVRTGNGSNTDQWQIIKENGNSFVFDTDGVVNGFTQWNISKMVESQWADTLYFDYTSNTLNCISNTFQDSLIFNYSTIGSEVLLSSINQSGQQTNLNYDSYIFNGNSYNLLSEIEQQYEIAPGIYDEMTSSTDFSYIRASGGDNNTGALDSMIHPSGAIMSYDYNKDTIDSATYFTVKQIAHNNGYNNNSGAIVDPNTYSYIAYDDTNVSVDSTGIYPQYNLSTVFPGGRDSEEHDELHPFGSMEYYYFNGISAQFLTDLPADYDTNVVTNFVLRGASYQSKINSDSLIHYDDQESSSEVYYWNVGAVPNSSELMQQLDQVISTIYNVATYTTNIYDSEIAMIVETHTSKANPQSGTAGQNQNDSIIYLLTYAFQQYPDLGPSGLNNLNPVAKKIKVVLHNTASTWDTLSCDVTQWTQWDDLGQPAASGNWGEWKMYKMARAGVSTSQAFDTNMNSDNWQLDKEILVRTDLGEEGGVMHLDSIEIYTTYMKSGFPSHPISSFTNSNPYTQECFYLGFEPYESFLLDPINSQLCDSTNHSGKYSLNTTHFDKSVILEPKKEQYICSFWYMTNDMIPTIVSVQIETGVILTEVLDPTFGVWQYIDLITDDYLSSESGDSATVNIDHGGTKLYIDDLRFSPVSLPFSTTVYKSNGGKVSAQIDNNGGTDFSILDRYKKNIIEVGPDSSMNVKSLSFYFDSRKGNELFGNDDLFNPTYPNCDITALTIGNSFWEGFQIYPSAYFPQANLHNMGFSNDMLSNSGTISDPGTAYASDQNFNDDDYVVFVEAISNSLGSGEELGISFTMDSGTPTPVRFVMTPVSFKLYTPTGNVLYDSIACSGSPQSSSLFIEILNQNHLFAYADGRFLFDYQFQNNIIEPFGLISTNENSYFDNFVLINNPRVSMSTYDAGQKQKQSLIRSTSTQVHTGEHLYGGEMDLMGATTHHAFVNNTDNDQTNGMGLTYLPDFAEYDPETQTVDTSSIVAQLYGYDNPYESSQEYYSSPMLKIQSSGSGGVFSADSMGTNYTYTGGGLTSVGINDSILVMNQNTNPDQLNTITAVNNDNTSFAKVKHISGDTISSQYEYDPFMRLEKEYQPNYFPDGLSDTSFYSKYTYNYTGNKTALNTPDMGVFQFVYTPDQLLFFAIDSFGLSQSPNQIQYLKYDDINRLTEIGYFYQEWDESSLQGFADNGTYPSWPSSWNKRWTYDGDNKSPNLGQLTTASTNFNSDDVADVTSQLKYDLSGNIIQSSTQTSAFNDSIYVFDFSYNKINQLTGVKSGNNYDVVYTYNNIGKISGIGTTSNPNYYASYEYKDTLLIETLNNGTIERVYDLNPAGWIDNITDDYFSDSLTYTKGGIDDVGYFDGSIASATSSFNWVNAPENYQYKYKYDGFGRLIAGYILETDQNDLNYATYDDNGNLKNLQRWKDKTVFWTNELSNKQAIQTAYIPDMSAADIVSQEAYTIYGMDVDPIARKVYWVDQTFKTHVANFDGSDQVTLPLILPIYPDGIALDELNQNIYYAIPFMGYIIKANTEGTNSSIIATDNHPQDIAVYAENNQIFWPDGIAPDQVSIKTSDLDGNNVSTLISFPANSSTVTGIEVDTMRNKIYWCTDTKIQRANLDGSDIVDVYTQGTGILRISLDIFNKEVFWTDSNSIQLIQFDGTGKSVVLNNLTYPEWIYQNLRSNIYTYQSGTNRVLGTEGTSDQFSYDASGKVRKNRLSNLDSLLYDNITNLTTAIYKGTDTLSYQYNYLNLRTLKSSGDSLHLYLYGNNNTPLIEKINPGNDQIQELQYVYGPLGLISIGYKGNNYFVLKDHLGSVRVVMDDGNTVAGWYNYSSFGNMMSDVSQPVASSTVPVNYLYTGQEYEPETELYNYKARLYDANLGRFYTTDPLAQYSSPYVYAGNDPVSNIDPNGTWGWKSVLGVVGGSVAMVVGVVTLQPEVVIAGFAVAGASSLAGQSSSLPSSSSPTPSLTGASKHTYTTKALDRHYIGEDKPGNSVWVSPPSEVKYLNSTERVQYELFVKSGKLVDKNGNLFDTKSASSAHASGAGRAIFVMGKTGRIFANKSHSVGKFHHSSFLAGQPVAAAGEIQVDNGVVKLVSNQSGHYRPSKLYIDQFIDELRARGVPNTSTITLDII